MQTPPGNVRRRIKNEIEQDTLCGGEEILFNPYLGIFHTYCIRGGKECPATLDGIPPPPACPMRPDGRRASSALDSQERRCFATPSNGHGSISLFFSYSRHSLPPPPSTPSSHPSLRPIPHTKKRERATVAAESALILSSLSSLRSFPVDSRPRSRPILWVFCWGARMGKRTNWVPF